MASGKATIAPFDLRVEGWRGINNSLALVNQYQLLELRKYAGIALTHRDLPFVDPAWNAGSNDSGFDEERKQEIEAIPAPGGKRPDAVYRISFPYRNYGADAERIFVFATAENHRMQGQFYTGPEASRRHPNGSVKFITCSNWSKAGIVAHGIAEPDVGVVPLGIDPEVFHPVDEGEKLDGRASLGIPEDGVVFLNVSAVTFNKGIDKLVAAFCRLKPKYPQIFLVLKDQSNLYGLTPEAILRSLSGSEPGLATQEAFAGIRLLSENFSLAQMRLLYGCADAYVSAYRAEGFNLPPLEAAACGIPVIVTAGGSTDDYCHPSFARQIASTRTSAERHGTYLEPDLDSLIAAMEAVIERRMPGWDPGTGAAWIGDNFSWRAVTARLVRELTGREPEQLVQG